MLMTLSSDNLSKSRTSSQVCHGRFLAESKGGVFSLMFRINKQLQKTNFLEIEKASSSMVTNNVQCLQFYA